METSPEADCRSSSWYRELPHQRLLPHLATVRECDKERLAALLVHGLGLLDLSYPPEWRHSSKGEIYGSIRSIAWTSLAEVEELVRAGELLGLVRKDQDGYYLNLSGDGMDGEGKRIAGALLQIRREERACRGCSVEEETRDDA